MTQDEFEALARKAGLAKYGLGWTAWESQLERFAELVAAAEREACATACEVNAARWIDSGGKQWYAAHECAHAIRARSKT